MVYLPPANEVWGKVMFLHLCVILFTGGLPKPSAKTPRRPPPADADLPAPGCRPRRMESPPPDTSASGRYASCWNAFLFNKQSFFRQLRQIGKEFIVLVLNICALCAAW